MVKILFCKKCSKNDLVSEKNTSTSINVFKSYASYFINGLQRVIKSYFDGTVSYFINIYFNFPEDERQNCPGAGRSEQERENIPVEHKFIAMNFVIMDGN